MAYLMLFLTDSRPQICYKESGITIRNQF